MIDKLRKIIAKAQDPAASEAEAEALMARAESIMREHGLSMEDVGRKDDIVDEVLDLTYADPWRRSVVFAVARYYYCAALNTEIPYRDAKLRYKWRKAFVMIGREGPRTVAMEMVRYLDRTIVRLSREHSHIRRKQLAYQRGAGEEMADRLHRLCYERERQMEQVATTGTDLILQETALVKQKQEELMSGNIRTRGSDLDSADSDAGREAAHDISLADQVGGGSEPVRLLS